MKTILRKLELCDLPKWERLAKLEFLESDFCSAEYLEKHWAITSGWVLQTENDEWIGCSFINTKHHDFNMGGVHFLQLCIFPKFRGRGFSEPLMRVMLDHAKGFRKSACINPQNIASIKIFKKFGFKKIKPHKTWDVYICDIS